MLKEGMRGSSARNPLRSVLVAAQVAIALVLLSGAGLLIRSFYEIANVDAGFNPEHVMTMQLAPALTRYRAHPDLQIQLARGILDKVSGLRGVRTSAISTALPLLASPTYIMRFEGRPPVTPSQSPLANYVAVTPAFFETMSMRLLRGRTLTERDQQGTPLVAVVNQTLVDRYFPHEDPIGKRLEIGFSNPPNWREIVGVVRDVKAAGLDQDTPVQVYAALLRTPSFPSSTVSPMTVLVGPPAIRGARHPNPLRDSRRGPLPAVYAIQPMTEIVSKSVAQLRLSLILLAFFAVSAMLLAAIGVYGVMSFVVAQRTSEIGIRMALGARAGQVAWHVQRQGMTLVGAGLAIGLAGGLLLTRYLTTLLFRVDPRDPTVFGIAATTLVVVSIVACWLPARRASRVDPLTALRNE